MKNIMLVSLILLITGVFANNKIGLYHLSDYGSTEVLISKTPTKKDILNAIKSIDWNEFQQVILYKINGDFMEVGGSLAPSDGLSVIYRAKGKEYVISNSPTEVDELIIILVSYFEDTETWKSNSFE